MLVANRLPMRGERRPPAIFFLADAAALTRSNKSCETIAG